MTDPAPEPETLTLPKGSGAVAFKGRLVADPEDFEPVFRRFIVRSDEVALQLNAVDEDGDPWAIDCSVPLGGKTFSRKNVPIHYLSDARASASLDVVISALGPEGCTIRVEFDIDGSEDGPWTIAGTLRPFSAPDEDEE